MMDDIVKMLLYSEYSDEQLLRYLIRECVFVRDDQRFMSCDNRFKFTFSCFMGDYAFLICSIYCVFH